MSDGALNLLVASSPDNSKCIQQALTTHYPDLHLHHVETKNALSTALETKQWNILFSEMELPDFSANDLPDLFEKYGLSLPVALIADKSSETVASRCLEYGMCELIQCDKNYLHYLPLTVGALLRRADLEQQQCLAEQQQIDNEERFLDIFNNTSDLIQCIAPDGSFIYTNNTWRKAMGYTREEAQSLNLMDVLHAESKDCCEDRFERLKQGEILSAIDFKFVTKSGETLHLVGDCGSILKDGVVTSTRGIFRNVSDTVRAKQVLKESESRYQSLYDLAPDIYTTINNNGEILSINQTGVDMLGYSKEELISESVAKLIHPEDQKRVFAHVKELFDSENNDADIEYRKVRKDGSVLWIHQCARLDKDAIESRLLIVCRDITVQRELQKQLAFHATHDSLTSLINRRELENRLQRVLSESTEHDSHVLCFLDLDEFKTINDTNGHAAGDELLRQVTTMLHEHIRSRDTLARIGGDEFVVLMEHCPLDAAVKLAKKLQAIISGFQFHWRAQTFSIGVSIGITCLQAGATVESTLNSADAACYKAKENGRNCIHVTKACNGK